MRPFCKVVALEIFFLVVSGFHPGALAQSLPGSKALAGLCQKAGFIFAGTVLAVERGEPPSGNHGVATMRVTFRVDDAIRGVQSGQTFVLREWAGLWGTEKRYWPGERLVVFLYPVSRLGLTSPVGGAAGRFPMDRNGNVLLSSGRGQTGAANPHVRKAAPVSGSEFAGAIRRVQEE